MPFKSKELEKEYNKKYYHENKAKIIEQMCKKEACPLCGRSVGHQNLIKHQQTKYCLTRREMRKLEREYLG